MPDLSLPLSQKSAVVDDGAMGFELIPALNGRRSRGLRLPPAVIWPNDCPHCGERMDFAYAAPGAADPGGYRLCPACATTIHGYRGRLITTRGEAAAPVAPPVEITTDLSIPNLTLLPRPAAQPSAEITSNLNFEVAPGPFSHAVAELRPWAPEVPVFLPDLESEEAS
jgi:hypothetical protein